MNNPSIDVPKIQEEIKNRHAKFTREYGSYSDKAIADDQFLADSAMAKINLISVCLKSEKVIDRVDMRERGPVKEIYLYKTGYNSYINVVTNGKQILMQGYGFGVSDFDSDYLSVGGRKRIDEIDSDSFDWEKFSLELLEFIYTIIYEKAKAAGIRLDDALYGKERPKCDLILKKVIKKNRTK